MTSSFFLLSHIDLHFLLLSFEAFKSLHLTSGLRTEAGRRWDLIGQAADFSVLSTFIRICCAQFAFTYLWFNSFLCMYVYQMRLNLRLVYVCMNIIHICIWSFVIISVITLFSLFFSYYDR